MRKLDTMEKFPETVEVEVLPVMECKLTDHRGPVRRFFGMFNPFKFRRRAGLRIDFLTLLLEAIYHAIDHQLALLANRVKDARADFKEHCKIFLSYAETVEGRLKIAREELDRLEQRADIKTGWLHRIDGNLDTLEEAVRDIREKLEENEAKDAELRAQVLEALRRFDARLEAVEAKAAPRRKTTVRKGDKR